MTTIKKIMIRTGGRKYPVEDITGQKFNYLTVIRPTRKRNNRFAWLVQCRCGKTTKASIWELKSEHVKSCGCQRGEFVRQKRRKHKGQSGFNALYEKYKRRAKMRSLDFSLTKRQFKNITQQDCWYCGIIPQQRINTAKHGEYIYNGVDRLNNHIGYTPENCVSCCGQCNWAKADMKVVEFLTWIRLVYENRSTRRIQNENLKSS